MPKYKLQDTVSHVVLGDPITDWDTAKKRAMELADSQGSGVSIWVEEEDDSGVYSMCAYALRGGMIRLHNKKTVIANGFRDDDLKSLQDRIASLEKRFDEWLRLLSDVQCKKSSDKNERPS